MILKGQKRKLEAEDAEPAGGGPLRERQRQFVFSVSLNKYQRGQELAEPSLRRSVLIANTLRHIALEEEEGGAADAESDAAAAPAPAEDEDWGSVAADPDFSFSVAVSSLLSALDSSMDGGPQAAPRPPLRSLDNLETKPGYLGDVAMEDLLQDVDGAQQQQQEELVCCLSPFSPAPSSRPFSHSLASGLRCLPSFPTPSSSSAAQNQARDGLEHLMEILVES